MIKLVAINILYLILVYKIVKASDETTEFKSEKDASRWNHTWLITGDNYANCRANSEACCFDVGIIQSSLIHDDNQKITGVSFKGPSSGKCSEVFSVQFEGKNSNYDFATIYPGSATGTVLIKTSLSERSETFVILADDKSNETQNPYYSIKLPSIATGINKDNVLNVLQDAYYFEQQNSSSIITYAFLLIAFFISI